MNSRWVAVLLFLILFVVIAGWWFLSRTDDRYSDDREVARAQKEFVEVVEGHDAETTDSEDGIMRISSNELEESIEDLDEEQRQEFAEGLVPRLSGMLQERFQRVIDLPPEQRQAALDRIIDQQPSQGQRIAQMAEENEGAVRQSVAVDGSTEDGQRWLMDNMTPEQRATMYEYMKLVRARMEERGLDSDRVPIRLAIGVEGSE